MDFGIFMEIKANSSFDYEEMRNEVKDYCENNNLKSFLTLDYECNLYYEEGDKASGLILMRYNYFDEQDEDLEETREFVYENEEENILLIVEFIKGLEGVNSVTISVEEI